MFDRQDARLDLLGLLQLMLAGIMKNKKIWYHS